MALKQSIAEDEAAIVRQARSGDREAFSQLIDNYSAFAYRIAYSILQNQSDAEDAVQESFITSFKSIKKLEKDVSFRSWLGRIVTTRSYDITRQRLKKQKIVDSQTMSLKMDIQQSSPVITEEKQALSLDIQQAISRLPELHRLATMLRYAEDASTDDIASVLNRPSGTIRRILSESYRMLRLYLQEDVN